MIYLDSAATSLQKPKSVARAVKRAVNTMASPGRGGYPAAMSAAQTLFECRESLCELFHVQQPEDVVFTSSATHGLNTAIKSLISPGDTVVISGYEHNAVVRTLHALGAQVRVAASPLFDEDAAVEAFAAELPGADAAVCCHVSNVFGFILPLARIAALCRQYGVPLIVDASQSAGCVPLDFNALGAAFAAMPGHKSLFGPQGTGVLLCAAECSPLLYGGTGSDSASASMPSYRPDALEAGTHNVPGAAGLLEGVRWVLRRSPQTILAHEREMTALLVRELSDVAGLRLYRAEDPLTQAGVLSVRFAGLDSETAASRLAQRGVFVRAGLHCAPLAHRTAGSFEGGTVRFSVSPFNTASEMRRAAAAVRGLAG